MNKLETVSLLLKILVILISLFSIVYDFGIVWRVEKKLDTAYKLFLAGISFFVLSEILGMTVLGNPALSSMLSDISRVIFAIFFLSGILEMRNLIRKMDGEK